MKNKIQSTIDAAVSTAQKIANEVGDAIEEVVVMERQGHIHAEIFPKGEEAVIRHAIDSLNHRNPVYKRIVSWELRDTPFDKTSSLKIRR